MAIGGASGRPPPKDEDGRASARRRFSPPPLSESESLQALQLLSGSVPSGRRSPDPGPRGKHWGADLAGQEPAGVGEKGRRLPASPVTRAHAHTTSAMHDTNWGRGQARNSGKAPQSAS